MVNASLVLNGDITPYGPGFAFELSQRVPGCLLVWMMNKLSQVVPVF